MTIEDKIDDFMSNLEELISCEVSDGTADCSDSYTGMGACEAKRKLEKSLYRLFNIKIEENDG